MRKVDSHTATGTAHLDGGHPCSARANRRHRCQISENVLANSSLRVHEAGAVPNSLEPTPVPLVRT